MEGKISDNDRLAMLLDRHKSLDRVAFDLKNSLISVENEIKQIEAELLGLKPPLNNNRNPFYSWRGLPGFISKENSLTTSKLTETISRFCNEEY